MKHILLIVFLLMIFSLSAETPIGLTLRMTGEVNLQRIDEINSLELGDSLFNNDIIRTYEESFAFLRFIDDGATLRLFENSILTLDTDQDEDKFSKTNYLEVGRLFTNVRENSGDLSVETPTTVASVKGTSGFIVVDADGNTTIIVLTGLFEVFNTISGNFTTVTGGNSCQSDVDGELWTYPNEDIDPDWLEDIDEDEFEDKDIIKIEMIREDGERRTIEIELE